MTTPAPTTPAPTTPAPTTPAPTAYRTGFAPRRLAHVNLFVGNLERSLDFYTRVCGLDVVFEEPGISAVFLSNGNSHHDLALMEITEGERVGRDGNIQVSKGRGREAGLNHLGFEMASEAALVEAIRSVRATGTRLHRTVDHQISHSAYLFDPDGTYVEMYADSTDDWRDTYAANQGALITGVWDPDAAAPDARERFAPDPEFTVMDDAALRPLRTARASVAVADLARATEYWQQVCGLTVLRAGPAGAVLSGGLGLADVTLLSATAELPVGLSHFGLELPGADELAAGAERVRAAGFDLVAETASDYKRSIVLRDPDGILVEFLVAGAPLGELPDIAPSAADRFGV
jgi:catechol 2,3-dioxygenase